MSDEGIIWMRDLDGTGSMHPCAPGDDGAILYAAVGPNGMTEECAAALRREFGYAPDEVNGEKWTVYEDRALIVIGNGQRPRIYRRGALDARDFYEFEPMP